jgi:3-(3-hydroxy-phenyl)propionate hydroxylase
VRDVDGTLSSFLPRNRTVMLLVRPDRYIAAAADSTSLGGLAKATRALVERFSLRERVQDSASV